MSQFGCYILVGSIMLAAFLIHSWIVIYNSLVESRNMCRNAFKNVEVQLRRRYDMIPQIVECVKGYAAHETKTLEAVVKARNAGLRARSEDECLRASDRAQRSLRKLFGLAESYPNLKSNKNFLMLQCSISEVEYQIACDRAAYNDAVRAYNDMVMRWPEKIVANRHGFKPNVIEITPKPVCDDLQRPPRVIFP